MTPKHGFWIKERTKHYENFWLKSTKKDIWGKIIRRYLEKKNKKRVDRAVQRKIYNRPEYMMRWLGPVDKMENQLNNYYEDREEESEEDKKMGTSSRKIPKRDRSNQLHKKYFCNWIFIFRILSKYFRTNKSCIM